ncbi:MAG: hypothetical protein JNM84_19260 [Planctomycetes bacterium]|nr:hypothetical protein [Planctomycetota bacterium]
MRSIVFVLASLAAMTSAMAQRSEYVVNGTFDQPLLSGWRVTLDRTPEFGIALFNTTGATGLSSSLMMNPGGVALQQTIVVPTGKSLDISVDLAGVPRAVTLPQAQGPAVTLYFDQITKNFGFNSPLSRSERARLSFTHTVNGTGSTASVELAIFVNGLGALGSSPLVYLDNVSIREANGTSIHFNAPRLLGAWCPLELRGTTGPFQLFISPLTLAQPTQLPGWSGAWELNPGSMLHLFSGWIDTSRRMVITLRPPYVPEASGVPIYWQALSMDAAVFPNEFAMGHAVMAAFF